jgi:hypothetical protein
MTLRHTKNLLLIFLVLKHHLQVDFSKLRFFFENLANSEHPRTHNEQHYFQTLGLRSTRLRVEIRVIISISFNSGQGNWSKDRAMRL